MDNIFMTGKLDEISKKLDILILAVENREKPFLDILEASEYLTIPKQTLYAFCSQNKIPYYKLNNRRLYFSVKELDEFILNENNRVKL